MVFGRTSSVSFSFTVSSCLALGLQGSATTRPLLTVGGGDCWSLTTSNASVVLLMFESRDCELTFVVAPFVSANCTSAVAAKSLDSETEFTAIHVAGLYQIKKYAISVEIKDYLMPTADTYALRHWGTLQYRLLYCLKDLNNLNEHVTFVSYSELRCS